MVVFWYASEYLRNLIRRDQERQAHQRFTSPRRTGAMPEMGTASQYNAPALADVRVWRVAGFADHLIRDYRLTDVNGKVVSPILA
jgi:hypothetical protein